MTLLPSNPGLRRILCLTLLGLTSACVSTDFQSRDWSTYEGPGARYFQSEEIVFPHVDDSIEPINRLSALVNYQILRWGIAPLSKVHRFVVPRPVRTRVAKAGVNLMFPNRFINNLLQGKFRQSGVEISRFAINCTVGLLGLFDPAQHWGLHPYPEDFGQTFASWGWQGSTYLFLPVLGPSTIRDGLGEIPDTLADPATYYFPATLVRGLNSTSNTVEANIRAIESAYDAYEPARTLSVLQRVVDVTDFEWHEDESGPTQTLGAIFLKPEQEDFGGKATTGRVRLKSGGRLPYSLWLQPEPAPLLYVIPGFGGNRLGPSTLALAEIGFEHGHSVVALSSSTNWEFMRFGASVTVPGNGPVDAHDVHVALTAIDHDIEARFPGRHRERRIVGLSLGAYHALLMAAGHERRPDGKPVDGLLAFDLHLALNPPVSMEHALLQLDRFYNAPLTIPAEERDERIEEIFGKVLYLSHGDLEPGMELPFTETESRFLIGLSFRTDLQFMILQSQDLADSGMLKTKRSRLYRAPAFREVAEYSYMEYVYAFLLPYFAKRDPRVTFSEEGARLLFERSDLHTVTDALRADERVRVFANQNDFLLRPVDLTWLTETLGDRLTLFAEGGHLGNIYREYLRDMIGEALTEGD